MNSISEYIKKHIFEDLSEINVRDVKVIYDVDPTEIIFQVPEGFTESDISTYLGDRFLKSLPSDPKVGEKKFGKNFENINDAYFEYEKFEVLEGTHHADYEWDAHYNNGAKGDKLTYCKIYGMKYIILFDLFTLMKEDGQYTADIFNKVFSATDYSDANKYPIKIKFNSKETEYTEE